MSRSYEDNLCLLVGELLELDEIIGLLHETYEQVPKGEASRQISECINRLENSRWQIAVAFFRVLDCLLDCRKGDG